MNKHLHPDYSKSLLDTSVCVCVCLSIKLGIKWLNIALIARAHTHTRQAIVLLLSLFEDFLLLFDSTEQEVAPAGGGAEWS